ncbi:DNA topoisomerase (ATP-hydrolyzing), partial [Durusdinium trenchii]
LVEEDEEGNIVPVDALPIDLLQVDMLDSVLNRLREYDPALDAGEEIEPFDHEFPGALPTTSQLLNAAREWTQVFSLVDASTLKASEPKMLHLPRQTANELVLASVLIPFVLCSAIDEIEARDEFWREVDTAGLENILVNQAALEASWKTEKVRQGTSSARALDLSIGELHQLAGCKALRRWAANWFRLVLIVCGKEVIYFKQKNLFRACPYLSLLPARQCEPTMEFDQTLGFPGEGPRALEFFCLLLFVGLPIKEPGSVSLSWTFAAISVGPNVAMAAPVEPRNAGDWKRATLRQGREPLPQGRPVLKITEKQREVLLEKFRVWLLGKGVIAAELFADTYHHVEEINCLLSMYGRELYKAAKVDIPDVISVCELAFRSLPPSAFLWPLSPQTLR